MVGEYSAYVAWIHTLPCIAASLGPCGVGPIDGRIVAHHAGLKGMSQRAHDETCVPLCDQHHRQWHDASGAFRHMDRLARRGWSELAIAATQQAYEGNEPRSDGIAW